VQSVKEGLFDNYAKRLYAPIYLEVGIDLIPRWIFRSSEMTKYALQKLRNGLAGPKRISNYNGNGRNWPNKILFEEGVWEAKNGKNNGFPPHRVIPGTELS